MEIDRGCIYLHYINCDNFDSVSNSIKDLLIMASIDAGNKKGKRANLLGSCHHSLWFEAASIIGGVHSVV